MPHTHRCHRLTLLCLTLLAGGQLLSCASPLDYRKEEQLRQTLLKQYRQRLDAAHAGVVIELQREPSDVERELPEARRAELDRISGIEAYRGDPLNIGMGLTGDEETQLVQLSLQQAIELAVKHNLDLQVARLIPAVARTRITQAEAAFDLTFFAGLDFQKLDTPQPGGIVPGLAGDTQSQRFDITTGLRQPLKTGGEVQLQTNLLRDQRRPSFFAVDRFYDANLSLSITQPLLRGFGHDVNTAQITLARSAHVAEVQQLRLTMINLAAEVEDAYWQLAAAKQRLLIQNRLLERTVEDRDRLKRREGFDVSPVRMTEANSFVELRRAEVIRARQQVRTASDALKRLINAPDLPLSDETLVVPSDTPMEDAIRFSLLDVVQTALDRRPEMKTALLSIKDASVRQRVAENARLPMLNLTAGINYSGLSLNDGADAWARIFEGNYIDYIVGAQFEHTLGNRSADAFYSQRLLERQASVVDYQRQAQDIVLEAKNAMRQVQTAYELIGATRAARRAAADSLRAIEEQERAGVALTPEFLLDLKLQTQQRLADAETQEVQALADYNNAIARLYQVKGTLLDRSGIGFDEEK